MTVDSFADRPARETHLLIESDKVQGTPVYRSTGERIGTVERVMIHKVSGTVAYAVMSFGGVLGIGKEYYPLPWNALTYNPQLEGYEINIDDGLKGAPKFDTQDSSWDWKSSGQAVNDYWCRLS